MVGIEQMLLSMPHKTNTKGFLAAADSSQTGIIKAYCGLVAIELELKSQIRVTDHNVPSSMLALRAAKPKPGSQVLNSFAEQLRNDIERIQVTGAHGDRRTAPHCSYPYIRYATMEADGWDHPTSTEEDFTRLCATIARIRKYLKTNYNLSL